MINPVVIRTSWGLSKYVARGSRDLDKQLGACISAGDLAVFAQDMVTKRVVGLWKFGVVVQVNVVSNELETIIDSQSTEVLPRYRGFGIAKRMWVRGIKNTRPKRICVGLMSEGGVELLLAVMRMHPRIAFEVCWPPHYYPRDLEKVALNCFLRDAEINREGNGLSVSQPKWVSGGRDITLYSYDRRSGRTWDLFSYHVAALEKILREEGLPK